MNSRTANPESSGEIIARWFPDSIRQRRSQYAHLLPAGEQIVTIHAIGGDRRWLLLLDAAPLADEADANHRFHLVDTIGAAGYRDLSLARAATIVAVSDKMGAEAFGVADRIARIEVGPLAGHATDVELGLDPAAFYSVRAVLDDGSTITIGFVSDQPAAWSTSGSTEDLRANLEAILSRFGVGSDLIDRALGGQAS
jgi:hypothetical protein